jgi:glyoxylase-like metal-dependent hydrolase (beta-lactamase superfamily II)
MISTVSGVHTITLPMPWELESVNVHLVELDDGYLLIDSGIATEDCFEALESALEERRVKWTDIKALCLTHLHPDHIGLSWKILELSGARLMMHRVEAEYLAQVSRESRAPFFAEAMQKSGVPVDLQSKMDRALRDIRRSFRPHTPDTLFEGGERIPIRGGTLEVVWTPGHSPGHICLYSPERHYLISGDHILEFITPNIGWHPDKDMLAQYLDSLSRLRPFSVDLVLPSHGGPFRGHLERIQATTEHHESRCTVIAGHLSKQPRTAHNLVEQVWPRTLSAFHHHFALFEILAHLEYMHRRGRVAPELQDAGALYWSAVSNH